MIILLYLVFIKVSKTIKNALLKWKIEIVHFIIDN